MHGWESPVNDPTWCAWCAERRRTQDEFNAHWPTCPPCRLHLAEWGLLDPPDEATA